MRRRLLYHIYTYCRGFDSVTAWVTTSTGTRAGLVECKGVDPTAPHLMAVACGDPCVRVFDRRRVGTGARL
jgi:hypothetical protein